MDLYRFFHPHHNPRLRNKPIRLLELSELELAAKELSRALERTSLRLRTYDAPIPKDLIEASLNAVDLAADLLHQSVDLHPEDSESDMKDLLEERAKAPGWEAWLTLLKERMESLYSNYTNPQHGNQLTPSALTEKIKETDSILRNSTINPKKVISA